ncbi:MAG: thioredoxin family protein [Phycisphaeraceae bacterium]|nr:MAG: thioredoxin family protein [Phycisphaeraceae bacterium]
MTHRCSAPLASRLPPFLIALAAAFLAILAPAGTNALAQEVRPSLAVSPASIAPGSSGVLVLSFTMEPGWHVYTWDADKTLKGIDFEPTPTEATPAPAPGLTFGTPQWPTSYNVEVNFTGQPTLLPVYKDLARVYIPFRVAPDAAPGVRTLKVSASWQACNDSLCLAPEDADLSVEIDINPAGAKAHDPSMTPGLSPTIFDTIGAAPPPPPSPAPEAATKGRNDTIQFNLFGLKANISGLVPVLLAALVAGFILNLTPCVLPVIPIKIMSLQHHAHGSSARRASLGLLMAAGIIAFWLVIGLLIVSVKSVSAVSELFANPFFNIIVAAVVAAMALGMMGAFTMELPASVSAYSPRLETAPGSFLFGVMTAILGTPCFGPFIGAAIAWAALQSQAVSLATFTAVGVGMALPYAVLAIKPSLADFVPRAGPASELVKQIMGLLLLAAAAFFLGSGLISLLAEMPYLAGVVHWWGVALFAVLAGLWLALRTFQITASGVRRAVFSIVALVIAGSTSAWALWQTDIAKSAYAMGDKALWKPYTPEAFDAAVKAGKVIVADFTATWCINCKILEATVLNSDEVVRALEAPDVAAFKVDLTNRKDPAWGYLKSLNETGIPVVAFHAPARADTKTNPVAKLYFGATNADVIDAVNQARSAR